MASATEPPSLVDPLSRALDFTVARFVAEGPAPNRMADWNWPGVVALKVPDSLTPVGIRPFDPDGVEATDDMGTPATEPRLMGVSSCRKSSGVLTAACNAAAAPHRKANQNGVRQGFRMGMFSLAKRDLVRAREGGTGARYFVRMMYART